MTDETRYTLNAGEIAAEVIGGEAVILNLSTGVYYSLDGAGGLAFALLSRGHPPARVGARLAADYEGVSEAEATADVERLAAELTAESVLVDAGDSVAAELEEHELPPAGEYLAPELQTFTDMGDLLALDPPMPGLKDVPWRAPGA